MQKRGLKKKICNPCKCKSHFFLFFFLLKQSCNIMYLRKIEMARREEEWKNYLDVNEKQTC